jgi:hypothetical protein
MDSPIRAVCDEEKSAPEDTTKPQALDKLTVSPGNRIQQAENTYSPQYLDFAYRIKTIP